jgi:SAM-dependent methyltransferase
MNGESIQGLNLDISPLEQGFVEELERMSFQPPDGDKRVGAFCRATLALLDEEPKFDNIISDYLSFRTDLKPYDAVQILRSAIQKPLLKDPNFPYEYLKENKWAKAITCLVNDEDKTDDLAYDLHHRNMQTNVVERYKSFKMILVGLAHRLDPNPKVMDVGCSLNFGLKQLALNRPFIRVRGVRTGQDAEEIIADATLTRRANNLLLPRLALGASVGIDLIDIRDSHAYIWPRSNFRPKDFLSGMVDGFDKLASEPTPENVDFFCVDFTNRSLMEELRTHKGYQERSFDLVTFSTIMYMETQSQRERMEEEAERWVKPDGIIAIQDFAYVPEDTPDEIEYYDRLNEHPYSYTTIVRDMADPNRRYHEIFSWNNGRNEKIQRAIGLSAMSGVLAAL